MKIEQRKWTETSGWTPQLSMVALKSARLVLVFGATGVLKNPGWFNPLKESCPSAIILGCSTAGEICGTQVSDDSLVVTAVGFEHTQLKGARVKLGEAAGIPEAGARLAQALPPAVPGNEPGRLEKLRHVFVLSDGLKVNGSDLARGLTRHLPEGVTVTGGMAGDGARFGETLVFLDSAPESDAIAVLGFYGSRLQIGFGSLGGWDSFGPERVITRSREMCFLKWTGTPRWACIKNTWASRPADCRRPAYCFP